MVNSDGDVRERMMRQEGFDASPDEEMKAGLLRRFRTVRKKLLVRLTVWVLAGLAVMIVGGYALGQASGTRAMLAALFVMLVGFESTVLIKLWYWTVDSKAALVEQVQRLALRMHGQEEPLAQGTEGEAADLTSAYDRVSMKWLGRMASVVILVPAVAFGICVLAPLARPEVPTVYSSECHAVVGADGAARVTGRLAFTYYGVTPLTTVRVLTSTRLQDAAWTDAAGRELPSTQEEGNEGWVSLVQLPEPVFRQEAADLRVTWTIPQAAREKDGVWTFSGDEVWRRGLWPQLPLTWMAGMGGVGAWSQGVSTVTLPQGAQMAPFPPGAMWWWGDYEGRNTGMFRDLQRTQGAIAVSYRLPEGR
jgi:hypothetical protein